MKNIETHSHFRANGKLLLTGEYFVLDGATALALPTKLGQYMDIQYGDSSQEIPILAWESYDELGDVWFSGDFSLSDFSYLSADDSAVAITLTQILQAARKLNPAFLQEVSNAGIKISLEFPRLWGFGSSSTLISLIAQWSKVDAFQLSRMTFGGSGYDIACATANSAILYQNSSAIPTVTAVTFRPSFEAQLYFVYLGKKQNSREGISRYKQRAQQQENNIPLINELTQNILTCNELDHFEKLLQEHENLISQSLDLPKVQDLYFNDFQGTIKSLGAWGGDFVLAASRLDEAETLAYFQERGFDTILRYSDTVL